ncbi:Transglutaminase-like enzyme, putative cysteine protease [Minicystis rosea]|nr:Transglutaminase-like enzyme, putative cysteine protease [Minicystis rosea]
MTTIAGTFCPDAAAEIGAIHPDLVKAEIAVRSAKGPEIYAALRDVWRMWDRADPAQVEEAIASVAASTSAAPPVKVYASLLEAYARRRRGDLDGAAARIQKLGFVGKWITVGPFDNENKAGFGHVYGPEIEIGGPLDPARGYDGKERPVRWRVPPLAASFGWVDLGEVVRPRENACVYATTFVSARAGTRAPRKVTLWMGTTGAFRTWWNGEVVLEDSGYRDLDIDRFATTVTLAPGPNRITVKVCGTDDAPKIALRIGDEKGAPDLGIDVAADPLLATKAVPVAAAKKDDKGKAKAAPKPAPSGPLGPMQAFEKMVAAYEGKARDEDAKETGRKQAPRAEPKLPPSSAAPLEAFARYLATTGGDSRPEHRARDLARRAAEAEPTVKRYLLAGQLAEDRNQRREWVDKATALADAKDVEVLLAQAQLARTSTNWRDAVPIFEKILAIDPDHLSGTLGLVELYIEAGLKRTALATLERAVERQPKSVALLRIYAGQLRALGRDTEAGELEARYSALRFDDSSFLSQQVELAVARRDKAGAERWLDRFIASEPDSTYARGIAARTYRALGQKQRAVASFQRALQLAPEDVPSLRALADLYGQDDQRDEQLKLLRQILALSPQAKDVREYVEHIEPPKPRADEAYAWAPERFLPMRKDPDTRYPKRTLRSLTVTTVFPNGLASRFRQVVFQPLTDEAAASGRQFAFEYQADKQAVQLRAAKVYRKDGKIDEAIESGESSANDPSLAMYTSSRTFYVQFPRLEPGDVVELRYRIEDVAVRNEIADYYGEVEIMGTDEPVSGSEYVLITPKNRGFQVSASRLPGLQRESKEEGDQRILRFYADKVEPVASEPVMPPWAEILPHVHVSTFKSWDEVGAYYWGLARDQLDVDDEVRRRVKEITKGLKDDAAKVKAIYKYATRLRYVALELGLEGIKPRRCAQTIARGWGDCKDKATVIVTMLREAGIPATLVLVRTGMRGGIEDAPASLAPFDHAIAYVPSLDLYLDGTAEHTGSTELPVMDRGAFGLQINQGKPKLVHLPQPPPEASITRRKIDIALAPDGSGPFTLDLTVSGAYAPSYRQRYLAEGLRRERAQRDLGGELGAFEFAAGKAGLELSDLEDEEQPVHLKAKGKAQAFARRDGETLVVPLGPTHKLTADYASLSKRNLDIDLHALTQKDDEWTIKLPPGMKIKRSAQIQPPLDTPFGRASLSFEENQGKVVVRASLAFKKTRITPAEYPAWRAFCEGVDRIFGASIEVSK